MEIHTINIEKIGLASKDPTYEDFKEVAESLKEAFSKLGFVYISGHGVERILVEDAMLASKEFFTLTPEAKDRSLKIPPMEQGYVKPNQEIFDAKEDWKEASREIRESYDVSFLDGPNSIFPDADVPNMRPSITQLAKATKDLAERLLRSLAIAIDKDIDFFLKNHDQIFVGENATKMRSLFYPPLRDEDLKLKDIVRCGTHSDYGTITLLYQDELGGLEVKAVDKSWIDAKPIPGTILINVGDLLEIQTNGLFPATRHRVMVPEEEYRRRHHRQSIVLFVHPNNETLVSPMLDFNGPPKYKPITALQHLLDRFNATYR